MNKKSKIIRSNKIINPLNSYDKLPPISLFIPIFQKFINNIMKNGKKNSAEKQLAFLIYYWKIKLKRDFFFDFLLILNAYIWPLILLKVKKHGKTVELPGVLQLEQRWYNNLKLFLKIKSRKFLHLTTLSKNNQEISLFQFKHVKKTTFRNIRFLRYRW